MYFYFHELGFYTTNIYGDSEWRNDDGCIHYNVLFSRRQRRLEPARHNNTNNNNNNETAERRVKKKKKKI